MTPEDPLRSLVGMQVIMAICVTLLDTPAGCSADQHGLSCIHSDRFHVAFFRAARVGVSPNGQARLRVIGADATPRPWFASYALFIP